MKKLLIYRMVEEGHPTPQSGEFCVMIKRV